MVIEMKKKDKSTDKAKDFDESIQLNSFSRNDANLDDKMTPPANWETNWDGIALMRSTYEAPIDTTGIQVDIKPNASKQEKAYHKLVGLMLSSRTNESKTHSKMKFLINEKDLSVKTILDTS